jgi:hypothetical protein
MTLRDLFVREPATRASDWLTERALELRAEAQRCLEGGFTHWSYEFAALAAITERAAEAERTNPPDPCEPCHVCKGKLACNIWYHRSLV